jgi:hypothetical protein
MLATPSNSPTQQIRLVRGVSVTSCRLGPNYQVSFLTEDQNVYGDSKPPRRDPIQSRSKAHGHNLVVRSGGEIICFGCQSPLNLGASPSSVDISFGFSQITRTSDSMEVSKRKQPVNLLSIGSF